MKELPLIFSLLLAFISCCYNPCTDYGEGNFGANPRIHSINFSPKQAKVGDTVTMVITKNNWNIKEDLNFNKDYEITDKGKIKYIGDNDFYYNLINGEEIAPITGIMQETDDEESWTKTVEKVTEYVSISSKSVNTSDSSSENCKYNSCTSEQGRPFYYEDLKKYYPGHELVTISFKVPANAKSGYIRTTTPDHFAEWGISAKKLIIVDDDGNEIK